MRKYLWKKKKKKKKKKKQREKVKHIRKYKLNFRKKKLNKNLVGLISRRRFRNRTHAPLSNHRQHAIYSVFAIYIINELIH